MVPDVSMVRPAGSAPTVTDHLYGGNPPVTFSRCEYAAPRVPAGIDEVVIVRTGELIARDRMAVLNTDALSVTITVNVDEPITAPVPDINPPALRLSPAGSDPLATDHVYGGDPPVALSVWEYGSPTVPAGNNEEVIVNTRELMVSDTAAVPEADALSLTFNVKVDAPMAVGVPVMVPPTRLSPGGND